jgi:hypothetical protein
MPRRVTFNDVYEVFQVRFYDLSDQERTEKKECYKTIRANVDRNHAEVRDEVNLFITDGVCTSVKDAYLYWRNTQCYYVEARTNRLEGEEEGGFDVYGCQYGWGVVD